MDDMAWIPKREKSSAPWIPGSDDPPVKKRMRSEPAFTVAEVAKILNVDKRTVYKWLMPDEDNGEAIIPAEGWYKLPRSGYIRIKKWVVAQLQAGGM